MDQKRVNLAMKPQEYFREQLMSAQGHMDASLDEDLGFYIVNLLVQYITPPKLAQDEDDSQNVMDYPLAILLKRAMEAPVRKRYRILKHLGDSSLYVSGFFQDYFNRKLFDVGYYITMGRSAYNHISSLANEVEKNPALAKVYNDLAENFHICVDLLSCVSDVPGLRQNQDLLNVYDRWNQTQSERLYKILQEAGITPVPPTTKSAS